jgi:hypothetical protein
MNISTNSTSLFNWRAFVISVVLGTFVSLGIAIVTAVTVGGSALGILGGYTLDYLLASLGGFGLLIVCMCCSALGFYVVQGALYAMIAHRWGTPLNIGMMALGGALSSLISAMMVTLCGSILLEIQSFYVGVFTFDSMLVDLKNEMPLYCVFPLLYMFLGALGAFLYTTIARSRARKAEQLG